jgi:hypothetical protein
MTLSFGDVAVMAALFLVIALSVAVLCFWLLFRWDRKRELDKEWKFWEQEFHTDWEEYQMDKADGEGDEQVTV